MYITDWMAKREALTPNALALVEVASGQRFTYRDLNRRANRLANLLLTEFGVARRDRLAILAMNRVEHLDLQFAAAKIGAIMVPLNFRLTAPELAFVVNDCQPRLVLYENQFAGVVEALQQQTAVEYWLELNEPTQAPSEFFQRMAFAEESPPPVAPAEFEEAIQIIYTSGTTGRPKGAILSHRMLFWNAVNTMLRDIQPGDVTLTHAPFFHTGGLNVYTNPLFHLGGTVVLMRSWNADLALELIERERITMFFAVPTQFQMMIDSPRFDKTDFSSLRFVVSGGAPCPLPIMRRFREKGVLFKQGYGLTEVGPGVTALNPEDAERKAGSIGVPNFHMRARLVDEAGRDVPRGEVGELILQAPSMFSGYWNNPEATAQALRPVPNAVVGKEAEGNWFHTGDLARQDEEGFLYIVDRKKDMYISGGENVYPAEVEAVVYTHPAILEVAVIGVPDEKWGEVGKMFVVRRSGASLTAEEILEFCRGKLAKYKIPKQVEFRESLPKSASGKILKRELTQS